MLSSPIILASTSPRRRELVALFDRPFQFVSADVDEAPRPNEAPADLVRRLSRRKAEMGARLVAPTRAPVIGADSIVCLDGAMLGKPADADDATRLLRRLRGRAHVVYSGVTVVEGARVETRLAMTTVWMREFSDAEMAAYVATGDPLDKAGAYAIQHGGFRPVARIEGCQANVMGLPLCHVYLALRALGIAVNAPDRACQTHLGIVCTVARKFGL